MAKPIRKGAEEARSQLPELLTAAQQGRQTIITRHGRAVAILAPVSASAEAHAQRSGRSRSLGPVRPLLLHARRCGRCDSGAVQPARLLTSMSRRLPLTGCWRPSTIPAAIPPRAPGARVLDLRTCMTTGSRAPLARVKSWADASHGGWPYSVTRSIGHRPRPQ